MHWDQHYKNITSRAYKCLNLFTKTNIQHTCNCLKKAIIHIASKISINLLFPTLATVLTQGHYYTYKNSTPCYQIYSKRLSDKLAATDFVWLSYTYSHVLIWHYLCYQIFKEPDHAYPLIFTISFNFIHHHLDFPTLRN